MIPSLHKRSSGFTLLEVLVALVIISIGAIGVAAIQAASLAGTHSSQTDSIVALEARSLADAMLANSAYWASPAVPTTEIDITSPGNAASINNSNLSTGASANCLNTAAAGVGPCTAVNMAGYDLGVWATEFFTQVPTANKVAIDCQLATGTTPNVCTINLTWTPKASTAINSGTQSTTTPTPVTYTLVNQF
jgi:type IV pilus assembly protein PilV